MNADLKTPAHPASTARRGLSSWAYVRRSDSGGLAWLTYPNADSAALAQRLKVALTDDQAAARCRKRHQVFWRSTGRRR
jgi:hypothetical protein